eukprot:Skav207879  [mRNA]  locus=scaffold664:445600:446540:- [translate_table: standard]
MNFANGVRQCSVSSHAVLHRAGVILGNKNDEEKFRYVSEELDTKTGDRYDYFISHNWSVRRWKKFLALCLLWRGKGVLVSCCVVQLLVFTLVALRCLPVATCYVDGHEISGYVWSPTLDEPTADH